MAETPKTTSPSDLETAKELSSKLDKFFISRLNASNACPDDPDVRLAPSESKVILDRIKHLESGGIGNKGVHKALKASLGGSKPPGLRFDGGYVEKTG